MHSIDKNRHIHKIIMSRLDHHAFLSTIFNMFIPSKKYKHKLGQCFETWAHITLLN